MKTIEDITGELMDAVDATVKSYRTDLEHDKRWIALHPRCPFLHFAGDTGTHIVPLCGIGCYPKKGEFVPYLFGHADRDHIRRQVIPMVESMRHNNRHAMIHHFDGRKLQAVTMDRCDKNAADYSVKMLRTFLDS